MTPETHPLVHHLAGGLRLPGPGESIEPLGSVIADESVETGCRDPEDSFGSESLKSITKKMHSLVKRNMLNEMLTERIRNRVRSRSDSITR